MRWNPSYIWVTSQNDCLFSKIFFLIQRKNKQKNIIIYLTNIAPSGLKYPN